MEIRKFQTSDYTLIEAFLTDVKDDAITLDPVSFESLHSAILEQEVAGIGFFRRSRLHSHVPRMTIIVHPKFRRRGVGQAIHEVVQSAALQSGDLGIDSGCFQQNSAAFGFMQTLGYTHLLNCSIVKFDLDSRRSLIECGPEFRFSQLNELFGDLTIVADFLHRCYCRSHEWNPVTISASDQVWKKIAFADADPELSTLMFESGRLAGAAISAGLGNDGLEIIWAFVEPMATEEQQGRAAMLIHEQCRVAKQKGKTTGMIEVDSVDPVLNSLLKWISPREVQVWQRFRKCR